MTTVPDNDLVRFAAQQWFARLLAPDCSDAERAGFERWRAMDPEHDAAYRQVWDVWQRSGALRDDPDIAAAVQDAMRPAKPRRDWSDAWPSLAAAASVLLIFGLVLWNLWPNPVHAVRYATALGEQRAVVLADGSHVMLDTDTELLEQFSRGERNLTLRHGQADFQVAHNADRPFVVHTGVGSVTATGTRFQVRNEESGSTVTLLEGRVIVAAADAGPMRTATLTPGERINITASGRLGAPMAVSETDLAGIRSWTEGKLVVKAWPLSQVVAEMNRYSGTKLRLADSSLASVPVSGVFKAGDQQSFVLALEYGWPVHAEQRPAAGEIVLSRK